MEERYRGLLASFRGWNHQRIQKRRWLRDQWASRDATSDLQSSRLNKQPDAPQAPAPASELLRQMPLPTKRSCLARLQRAGVSIDTVVDVGVQEGTPELIAAFPRARHLLFEPLASLNPLIEKTYAGVQHELHNVACFSDDGQSYLIGTCIDGSGRVTHTHVADTPNAPGIGTVVNSQPIQRVRLDSMNLTLGAHVLLKVDVDGVDLEVLKGATELLARSEVVIVEAPLSRLIERCDFMVERGFCLYDIVDLCYYRSILAQIDVVFVKAELFKRHIGLTPWTSTEFSWDAYRQLSMQLDAQQSRPGIDRAISESASATSNGSVVAAALPIADSTRPPSTPGTTASAMSGGKGFADNDVRIHGLLRDSGLHVAVIYDVGALNAGWSAAICDRLFPDATFHLFEPLAGTQDSYAELLRTALAQHPNFRLHPVALGDREATVDFWSDSEGFSSSALDVGAVGGFSRRTVEMVRLDDYVERQGMPLPDLIKLDVQGLEGQILRNAQRCMRHATVLQIECWFYPGYGPGTSLVGEIIDLVGEHGFDLVELGDHFYSDQHRLYAADAFFVKRDWAAASGRQLPIGSWVKSGSASLSSLLPPQEASAQAAAQRSESVDRDDVTKGVRTAHSQPSLIASSRVCGPLDVVVTPNEMNDLHGTGFLVKRVFAGWSSILSLRIRDEYGGVHDFGAEAHRLDIDPGRRPQVYAAALAAVADRPVRAVYCVPFTSADLMLAMAVADVSQAPLCLWEMDDQCVALPNISRALMREFLQKCRLRLATHTELRDAYEATFGLRFGVLPAVVPAALVRPGISGCLASGANGALLGSVWSSEWLVRLAAMLSAAGESLDWYGNHRSSWPRIDEATLAAMPLRAHGVVAEAALADVLLGHPFAVVPTDALDGPPTVYTAIAELSLPGRILFAAASAQIPILLVGSERTPAAAFVLRHGIGRVVPYDPVRYRIAAAELRDPSVQVEMRARAAALAPGLSDAGVGEWLRASVEAGQPHDDRFERLFPRGSQSVQEFA